MPEFEQEMIAGNVTCRAIVRQVVEDQWLLGRVPEVQPPEWSPDTLQEVVEEYEPTALDPEDIRAGLDRLWSRSIVSWAVDQAGGVQQLARSAEIDSRTVRRWLAGTLAPRVSDWQRVSRAVVRLGSG